VVDVASVLDPFEGDGATGAEGTGIIATADGSSKQNSLTCLTVA
jgi:hypothetical protein